MSTRIVTVIDVNVAVDREQLLLESLGAEHSHPVFSVEQSHDVADRGIWRID